MKQDKSPKIKNGRETKLAAFSSKMQIKPSVSYKWHNPQYQAHIAKVKSIIEKNQLQEEM
jgi:hypothetical protein